jgi:TP901 family phage tail tape measure protein
MAFVAGAIKGVISLDTSKWQKGLSVATDALKAFSAVAGVALIKATSDANDYHVALSRVAVVAQGTDINMKSLGQTMLKVNPIYGSATSLMKGYELAVSSGARSHKEAMDVVIDASKFAISHVTEHSTVVDMLTTMMNSYSVASEKAALSTKKIVDVMDAVIAYGKADAPGLAKNLGQLAPMLGQLDVPFEQVGAAIAVMTNNGVSASRTMTQLRALLSSFLKPAPELQRVFDELFASTGKYYASAADFVKEEGLTGVFNLLNTATAEQSDRLAKILPNMRALMGAYSMAGGALDQYTYYLKEMENSEGRIDKSFALKEKTLATLQNLYKNISSILGEPVWVALKGHVDAINDSWKDMSDYLTGPGRDGLFDFAITVNKILSETTIGLLTLIDNTMRAVKGALATIERLPIVQIMQYADKQFQLVASSAALSAQVMRASGGVFSGIKEFERANYLVKIRAELSKSLTDALKKEKTTVEDLTAKIAAWNEEGKSKEEIDKKISAATGGLISSQQQFLVAISKNDTEANKALAEYYSGQVVTVETGLSNVIEALKKGYANSDKLLREWQKNPPFSRAGGPALPAGTVDFGEKEEVDVLIPQINWVGGGSNNDFITASVAMYTSAQDVIMAKVKSNAIKKFQSDNPLMPGEILRPGMMELYGEQGEAAGKAYMIEMEKQLKKQKGIMTAISQLTALLASAAQGILNSFQKFSDLHFEGKMSKVNKELFTIRKDLEKSNTAIENLTKTSTEWEDKIKDINEQLGLTTDGEKSLPEIKEEHEALIEFMEEKYGLQLAGLQEFKDGEYAIALAAYEGSLALMSEEDRAKIESSALGINLREEELKNQLAIANQEKAASDKKILEEEANKARLLALEEEQNKKLEAMRKKQFENNKKFSIAQVWIDTAMAVSGFWASLASVPGGQVLATIASAAAVGMGVAQTALINQQEYVPEYASGTANHPGGAALVGEQGPEIVNLPRGTSVIPNARSMAMMGSGANGSGTNYIFNFNNPVIDNKDRMNEIVNRVERELGQRMKGRVA